MQLNLQYHSNQNKMKKITNIVLKSPKEKNLFLFKKKRKVIHNFYNLLFLKSKRNFFICFYDASSVLKYIISVGHVRSKMSRKKQFFLLFKQFAFHFYFYQVYDNRSEDNFSNSFIFRKRKKSFLFPESLDSEINSKKSLRMSKYSKVTFGLVFSGSVYHLFVLHVFTYLKQLFRQKYRFGSQYYNKVLRTRIVFLYVILLKKITHNGCRGRKLRRI